MHAIVHDAHRYDYWENAMPMIRTLAVLVAVAVGWLGFSQSSEALSPQEELIEESRLTVLRLVDGGDYPQLRTYIQNARGIMIIPELVRGGFVLGGEGGTGVMLLRQVDGSWGYPTFVSVASGSVGIQIGGQISEVVLTVMTDEGVNTMLSDEFTLGADLNAAAANYGVGIEGGTALDRNAEMYAFSYNSGLFVGGALEGTVLSNLEDWNQNYYAPGATAEAIRAGLYTNSHAEILRQTLP